MENLRPHLEYVGAKPLITPNGIDFAGKEDKFNFIEPAAYLLRGLIELNGDINKIDIEPKKVLKEDEIYDILYKAAPNFGEILDKDTKEYEQKLEHELELSNESLLLSQSQKETYKNNLLFMKEYRIKRAINKVVYEELINASVRILKEKSVGAIATPFSDKFLHVCESLRTTLSRLRNSPKMSLNAALDRANPYTLLTIGWY